MGVGGILGTRHYISLPNTFPIQLYSNPLTMDVSVTEKELNALQKVSNMQIAFLEYNSKKKCFSTEISVDSLGGDGPKTDSGEGRKLYEFWGPNKHQSLLPCRIHLENKWRE